MSREDDPDAAMERQIATYNAAFSALCASVRGRDAAEAERLVRDFALVHQPHARDVDLALTARVLSDPRWARKHPVSAVALAWKHRATQHMGRSLRFLWQPRFAG